MKHILEPELMNDPIRPRPGPGLCNCDVEQPHSMFIQLYRELFSGFAGKASVLDLGCGPGDITFRCARAYPGCRVHGIDGSAAILALAEQVRAEQVLAAEQPIKGRVIFPRKY